MTTFLTRLLLMANLAYTKMMQTRAHGYSSENTQQELYNEYQNDEVWMVFKDLCVLVLWTKVASALEALIIEIPPSMHKCLSFLS